MRPEKKPIELSENEKIIFDILKKEKNMSLDTLKEASGLSNKAWDKGIKSLGKHGLAKVAKVDDALIVEIQE
jgi:lysyl-tRNA synthetase class 2